MLCPEAKILNFDLNEIERVKEKFNLVSLLDVLYHESIINPKKFIQKVQKLNSIVIIEYIRASFELLSGNHSKFVNEKRRFRIEYLEHFIKF